MYMEEAVWGCTEALRGTETDVLGGHDGGACPTSPGALVGQAPGQTTQPSAGRQPPPAYGGDAWREQQGVQSLTLPRTKHRQEALHKNSILGRAQQTCQQAEENASHRGRCTATANARTRKQTLQWILYPSYVFKGRELAGHSWAWIKK